MPAFMKLGDIKGESGDARFPGWIPLESVQIPLMNPAHGSRVITRGRGEGPLALETDITVTMRSSAASPLIQQAVGAGKAFPLVMIVLDPAGTVELTNAMISSYSFSSAGDVPVESLSFNFTNLTEDSSVIPQSDQEQIVTALEDKAEVVSNSQLDERITGQPAEDAHGDDQRDDELHGADAS